MAVPLLVSAVLSGVPCHGGLDCNIHGWDGWRCAVDTTAPLPAGSCHYAAQQTNTTCSCSSPACTPTADTPKNASALQYLMIGDSVSMGMQKYVNATVLEHGWELTHNPSNADSTNLGDHCLGNWTTTNRKWDVISFNFGLHDIAYDAERLTAAQYHDLLTSITAKLVAKRTADGTKLLWVRTTPVPNVGGYDPTGPCNDTKTCINPPRNNNDVVLYNSIADTIMKANNIPSVDMYTFVVNKCGGEGYEFCTGFQLPYNVHYTTDGWTNLSSVMSTALLQL